MEHLQLIVESLNVVLGTIVITLHLQDWRRHRRRRQ
jgi:hypothetical protein